MNLSKCGTMRSTIIIIVDQDFQKTMGISHKSFGSNELKI